ncbi:Receptor-like protein 35 [Glycine soja]
MVHIGKWSSFCLRKILSFGFVRCIISQTTTSKALLIGLDDTQQSKSKSPARWIVVKYFTDPRPLELERLKALRNQWAKYYLKVLLLTLWPDSSSTNEEQEALLQSRRGVGPTISEYCKWNGIVCNEAQSWIHWIETQRKNLHRNKFLKKLIYLDLSSNCLQGELPSSLSSLTQLETLNISNNFLLTGVIPPTLDHLKNLTLLSLDSNQIQGHIPEQLGNLRGLEQLILSNNSLSGSILSTLNHLIHLKVLDLSYNKIFGVIPEGIFALTELTNVQLSWNQISGSIPSRIGQIPRLGILDISNNQLEGPIPYGVLNHCSYVQLRNNSLNGSIPPQIGNISYLDLSYNDLTRNIPTGLYYVPYLNLSYNSFNESDNSFCDFPKDSLIGNKDFQYSRSS